MTTYQPKITYNGDSFFALIVKTDRDGEESVVNGYSRFFKTRKAAQTSANKYIAKHL